MGRTAVKVLVIACCCAAASCTRAPANPDAGAGAGGAATGGAGGPGGQGAGAGGEGGSSDTGGTAGATGGGAAGAGGPGAIGGAGAVGATGGSTGGLGGGPDGGGDGDTHSCGAGILADSICDFTGEQGRYGWSYGFIEPQGANAFVPMSIYLATEKRWYAGTGMWTHIGDVAMHGNGTLTSGGMTPVEQWAVRRWQSSVSGTIKVDFKVFKLNASAGQDGSGVMARVVIDGVSAWSQVLEPTDGVGVHASVSADVNVGSTVDLVLDPYMGDDRNDETSFSATITQ